MYFPSAIADEAWLLTQNPKSPDQGQHQITKYIEMTNVKLSISTLTLIQMSMVK